MSDRVSDIDNMVIQSYLDGELEGADLSEFERMCSESPALRAAVEEAEKEHDELRDLLRAPLAPESLRARIAEELEREDRKQWRQTARAAVSWSLPGASIAAAAAGLLLFVLSSPDTLETDTVTREAVQQRIRTQVPTPVVNRPTRTEVSSSLRRYFSKRVAPPRFASETVTLDGWRPARLRGHDAVELRYTAPTRTGRHLVTLFVLDGANLEFTEQRALHANGRTLWLDSPFGFSTASFVDDSGVGYIFLSEMAQSELVDLVLSSDLLHRVEHR